MSLQKEEIWTHRHEGSVCAEGRPWGDPARSCLSVCRPRREASGETTEPTPRSWTSSLQDLGDEKCLLFTPRSPSCSVTVAGADGHTAFHPISGHPPSTSWPSLTSHTCAMPTPTSKLQAFLEVGCHTCHGLYVVHNHFPGIKGG